MDINYEKTKETKCHNSIISRVLNLNNHFLTASIDKTIKLWHKSSFTCSKTFQEHQDQVSDILMLTNELFASASHDKTIRIWNINQEKSLQTLSGHSDKINCLKLLPKGLLVSGSSYGCIKVCYYENGECMKTLEMNIQKELLVLNQTMGY